MVLLGYLFSDKPNGIGIVMAMGLPQCGHTMGDNDGIHIQRNSNVNISQCISVVQKIDYPNFYTCCVSPLFICI